MVVIHVEIEVEDGDIYSITVDEPEAVRAINQMLKAREELLAGLKKEED